MDRWWTDPEQSAQALGRVDASDVVQGVGTAVLGYHGLSEAVLRPLSQRTLVDGQQIADALGSIDLEPVAKALSAATFPVMGESSVTYGRMLAEEIHKDAVDSTTRLVQHLVATGMAWPTAVERAASVHGVPVDRLGKAGATLKAPSLARIAQADVSDRALMSFAKHVGLREDTRDVVTKAEQERFREEDVRRDALGRFADKPDTSLGGLKRAYTESELAQYQEKQRRREAKRKKRLKRVETKEQGTSLLDILRAGQRPRQEAEAAVSQAKRSDGTTVADAVRAQVNQEVNRQVKAQVDAQVKAKVARMVDALANRTKTSLADTPPDDDDLSYPPEPYQKNADDLYEGFVGGSDSQQLFMLVSKEVLELALEQGKFNYGKFRDLGGVYENELFNREELRDAVLEYSYGHNDSLDDVAVLAFDGDIAYHSNVTSGYEVKPADEGMYAVTHRNRLETDQLETDDYLDMDLKVYVTPGMTGVKKPITLPNLTVVLANEDEFAGLPGKRLKKSWNENEVVRDELGRFAEEGKSGITPSQVRRQQVVNRKQAKARKRLKRVQQGQDTTLLTVLQAGQTRAQQAPAAQAQASAGQDTKDLIRQQIDAEIKRQAERQVKVGAQREIARAAQRVADRQEALDDFRFAHEEWKDLEAVVFSDENDMLKVQNLFDYDPFNDRPAGLGSYVDEFERAETAADLRTNTSQAIAESFNNNHTRAKSYLGNPEVVDAGYHFPDAFNAYAYAESIAKERTYAEDDAMREWVPLVEVRQESELGYPTYVPAVAQVTHESTDFIVLGSKEDWAAVKRGDVTTLEPLPGYDRFADKPGLGMFNELFAAVGSDESYGRWADRPTRSDFYVRAFRIKR